MADKPEGGPTLLIVSPNRMWEEVKLAARLNREEVLWAGDLRCAGGRAGSGQRGAGAVEFSGWVHLRGCSGGVQGQGLDKLLGQRRSACRGRRQQLGGISRGLVARGPRRRRSDAWPAGSRPR
jgi:hypothetical protein